MELNYLQERSYRRDFTAVRVGVLDDRCWEWRERCSVLCCGLFDMIARCDCSVE